MEFTVENESVKVYKEDNKRSKFKNQYYAVVNDSRDTKVYKDTISEWIVMWKGPWSPIYLEDV